MKTTQYQPLWLVEQMDSNNDVVCARLLTKNIHTKSNNLHSMGIFTKQEQIALGKDIYGLDNLREIYWKAEEELYELLWRLVRSWQFTTMIKKLRGNEE